MILSKLTLTSNIPPPLYKNPCDPYGLVTVGKKARLVDSYDRDILRNISPDDIREESLPKTGRRFRGERFNSYACDDRFVSKPLGYVQKNNGHHSQDTHILYKKSKCNLRYYKWTQHNEWLSIYLDRFPKEKMKVYNQTYYKNNLNIAMQLLKCVDHIHKLSLVHGNLNFQVCRIFENEEGPSVKLEGFGSPQPNKGLLNSIYNGQKKDLWDLGIVLLKVFSRHDISVSEKSTKDEINAAIDRCIISMHITEKDAQLPRLLLENFLEKDRGLRATGPDLIKRYITRKCSPEFVANNLYQMAGYLPKFVAPNHDDPVGLCVKILKCVQYLHKNEIVHGNLNFETSVAVFKEGASLTPKITDIDNADIGLGMGIKKKILKDIRMIGLMLFSLIDSKTSKEHRLKILQSYSQGNTRNQELVNSIIDTGVGQQYTRLDRDLAKHLLKGLFLLRKPEWSSITTLLQEIDAIKDKYKSQESSSRGPCLKLETTSRSATEKVMTLTGGGRQLTLVRDKTKKDKERHYRKQVSASHILDGGGSRFHKVRLLAYSQEGLSSEPVLPLGNYAFRVYTTKKDRAPSLQRFTHSRRTLRPAEFDDGELASRCSGTYVVNPIPNTHAQAYKFKKEIGFEGLYLRDYQLYEYADGDLKDCMEAVQKDPLPISKKVLEGLQNIHENDIVHCDIKPMNILVFLRSNGYTIKITDFDLAIDFKDKPDGYTHDKIHGTLFYIAPERFSGSTTWSKEEMKKADLWSLGVMFLEMFTGTNLRENLNMDVRDRHSYKRSLITITQDLIDSAIRAKLDLSDSRAKILNSLLQINPKDRKPLAQILQIYDTVSHSSNAISSNPGEGSMRLRLVTAFGDNKKELPGLGTTNTKTIRGIVKRFRERVNNDTSNV